MPKLTARRYRDLALGQPVAITRNGRDRLVFAAGELPGEVIDAVARTSMDARHSDLDELLKDWTL